MRSDPVVLEMSTQHYEENEGYEESPTLAEKAHTRTEFLRILRFLRSRCSLSSSRYTGIWRASGCASVKQVDCSKVSPDSRLPQWVSQTASGGDSRGRRRSAASRDLTGASLSVRCQPSVRGVLRHQLNLVSCHPL